IDGHYRITHEDYVTGKKFDDAVSYSYYPIDLHDAHGVIPDHLEEGVVPTIPLRALVPKNSRNFIVAGRCLSSDRLANSALRVQASCMGMGQAAAAAAVLASRKGISPLEVPYDELRELIESLQELAWEGIRQVGTEGNADHGSVAAFPAGCDIDAVADAEY